MADGVRPEILIARLMSDNEVWRVDAEGRLVDLGPAAVDPLIAALRHASPAVRIHAVHALARIGDPRGISHVVHALADAENNGAVAIAAEKALIQYGAAAKPALLDLVKTGPAGLRPRALRALGAIGGEDLESHLVAWLADSDAAVRTQAAAAFIHGLGERAIDRVTPLLDDPDKWVRYGVAEALVQIGCVRGESALQDAKADPEEAGTYIPFWAEDLLDEIDDLRRAGRAIA